MYIQGTYYRSIWHDDSNDSAVIFDQTLLPHQIKQLALNSLGDVCHAIASMQVRGAPLIGACAAFGLYFALRADDAPEHEASAAQQLIATRPTAINLRWAVERVREKIAPIARGEKAQAALQEAKKICDEDAAVCSAIGDHGLTLIQEIYQKKSQHTVNILTHCNAGWIATVDWGTALAPIYKAHLAGIPVHVWVDETRPRLQGALTAWELQQAGVPHTYITDNTGGHLMQHGLVDLCIVGTDRTTAQGDVCNKIGTYLKALAAQDNKVPFYVALPTSTIDWTVRDGVHEIPIEERDSFELTHVLGVHTASNTVQHVRVTPEKIHAANYAFDVTPARLVSGLITEFGIFSASSAGLENLRNNDAYRRGK
ncbi:MAG TPA: S-methyl-5-thioribose-1-phosphate isomerase [Pseudomonadales bacterium]|jgi:methylthioribose-1-phosphate isomerase|nr:S-methyl-5-thioribose-1-phosphate isomerase [Pseudomonadales bacterium]HNN86107.1 S-methyl-5-thioribose-1-phosphate isomerase [Pseudomonadales bacterium]